MNRTIESQIKKICEGTASVIPLKDLEKKLLKGIPLNIKLGADPTAPNLHLGHVVVLEKLKDLQDLGHQILFLIGDFTGRIGDPTGKSKTRPPLTEEQIEENTKTYISQIGKVLDLSKTKIVYNSAWLDKLTSRDWIKLCSKVTLLQIIEREDFSKRLTEKTPIGFHELLYPILQAYDSVVLKADIEIGGTDQTFNLMMGRSLQEEFNQEPQITITMPILEGLDGIQKMSKSLKNDIGLMDKPKDVFGKLMSISDKMMWKYYLLLLRKTETEIEYIKNSIHPIEAKKNLAYEVIKKYWSEKEAIEEKKIFEEIFQENIFENATVFNCDKNKYNIIDLIVLIDTKLSRSETRRLIESGAVSINKNKILDHKFIYNIIDNDFIKIGKHRIYKIKIK
jgi:tyrosyl-tRNA synthetase